jgi:hypothetical protein
MGALMTPDSAIPDDEIARHIENCFLCRAELELPPAPTGELLNLRASPASPAVFDGVMAVISAQRDRSSLKVAAGRLRIASMGAAYLALVSFLIFKWNILADFIRNLGIRDLLARTNDLIPIVSPYASRALDYVSQVALMPSVQIVIFMALTILWSLTALKLRDFLKN